MKQPQQQDEEHELDHARVELGGVQGYSQRGPRHGSRTAEDHGPGQLRRDSIVTSSLQAGNGSNGTHQRQAGGKGIGGAPEGETEMYGVGQGSDRRQSDRDGVLRPAHKVQEDSRHQDDNNGQQRHAPDLVGVERKQAGGTDADQQGEDRAQGNQESISRQDEAAELEEVRVHEREQTKPTHWAVQQCAGEPVLRRWDSPQLFRHSGLADTAHGADCSSRVPVR